MLICVLGLLAGCTRGPAPEVLQEDLQGRLDTNFEQGLFEVRNFRRMGSAPFQNLESSVSGIYIYFDSELVLKEDYNLTQWRGLNLGTLAYTIGATEAGIDGFRAQGNQRGDILKVHGRFVYEADDSGGWRPVDLPTAPSVSSRLEGSPEILGRSLGSVLRGARDIIASQEDYKAGTRDALIIEVMDAAINQIDLRVARLDGKIILGTGAPPGTYYSFGVALSHYSQLHGMDVYSATSEGSVENGSRLQAGTLDFGLVQSDVAQLLYKGLTAERYFPNRELRAVASLWPEAVHLLTLNRSGIEQLADLQKKKVAIGQRGSGSRINALLIGLVTRLGVE